MDGRELVQTRKTAYQLTFQKDQPANVEVMIDVARFCRANETCIVRDKNGAIDTNATLVLEGRREVWNRIQQHLGLTPEQLFSLYSGNLGQLRKE